MFSVNTLYKFTYTLVNKDQTGADFTSVQFNTVLPEKVNELIEQYFGKPKWEQNMPQLAYERKQAIKDYISNSEIKESISLLPNSDGIISLPSNYFHLSLLSYQYYTREECVCTHCGCTKCTCPPFLLPKNFKKGTSGECRVKTKMIKTLADVTIVDDSQWNQLHNDSLLIPDLENPYGRYVGKNKIEVSPQKIPQTTLSYIRYPLEARWGFIPTGGLDVYDPNTSQDIELPRILLPELSALILESIGYHSREYWMQQISQQKVMTT